MKITIYGAGYVGLVTATCLAEFGNQVLCVDINDSRIDQLNAGVCPIHEPSLAAMMQHNQEAKRLSFSTEVKKGVLHGFYQFIAVGTPQSSSGAADISAVTTVAKQIGNFMEDYRIVITKSTVPVGTNLLVKNHIKQALDSRHRMIDFDVVSNPEFLREGAAVNDFMNSDRIVIGVENERARQYLQVLYAPFNRNQDRLITMGLNSAELTKYAANAMLATKISFINEMSRLAECLGADIEQVRIGIGADPRIGYHFINPGPGYGGSCFPKDTSALEVMADEVGLEIDLIRAVRRTNEKQKHHLGNKILQYFHHDLANRVFSVWGLSFKPNTDDLRESPSLSLLSDLWQHGARVQVYDPVAMPNAKQWFGTRADLLFCDSLEQTLENADALCVLTEWHVFHSPDFELIKNKLKYPVIFDGRNIYDPTYLANRGIEYVGIGRGLNLTRDVV